MGGVLTLPFVSFASPQGDAVSFSIAFATFKRRIHCWKSVPLSFPLTIAGVSRGEFARRGGIAFAFPLILILPWEDRIFGNLGAKVASCPCSRSAAGRGSQV